MSTRAPSLIAIALAACTSREPPVGDPIEDALEQTLSSRALPDDPLTWANRVIGDELVELAVLGDGSSVVVTEEGSSTLVDAHAVIARHDPFGQLLDLHEFPTRVGSGPRLFAIDGDGRLVVLAENGRSLLTVERDASIVERVLEWPHRGLAARAMRGHPEGGFLVRAEVPRARDAQEYAWWSPSATYVLARFETPPVDPKQPWRPAWTIEIGDEFAEDPRAYGPIEVFSDGRIATVARCQDATGRRCTGANGRELGVWSSRGEPQMRVALPMDLDVVLAAGEHVDGGLVVVSDVASRDQEERRDLFVARFDADGKRVSGFRTGLPDVERIHHAAIASGVVWAAATLRDPDEAPTLPLGAVVRVDAGLETVDILRFAPREPSSETSPADVLRPVRVAAVRGRVRVAGWYGWPSRLEFPDGSTADLDLVDARGVDDDVFVWAAAGRSALRN